MRHLLAAHSLIWALDDPTKLGAAATEAIQNPANELLLSAGAIWEVAVKVALNKLTLSLPYRQWMGRAITDLALALLPITVEHADTQIGLPRYHRDAFDRLLVAQTIVEKATLVSADDVFDRYGVTRVWK